MASMAGLCHVTHVGVCSRWRAPSSSAVRRRWISTSAYPPTPSTFGTPPACWRSEHMTRGNREAQNGDRDMDLYDGF